MAQYQLSFESTPLYTYPAELTRRWNTGNAAPSVKEASNALGFTRCLENLLSASTRQLDAVNAIDADADRADVKFRTLVYVGEAGTTTTTPVWACVARASGASGAETGYVLAIAKYSGNFRLSVITYKAGAAASSLYGSSNLAWTPNTWYLVEGSVSGTDPVAIEFSLYALTDLVNPVSSMSLNDSSADKITAAGWVGFGRFGISAVSRFSYASFATGTSELATDPWDAEPDTTAPTLTLPSATPTGTTTASGSVTTDEANGTLYYLASANATELLATVKAGSSQAVTAIGVQPVTVSGLTASTPYYLHFVHTDAAANDSAVETSEQFTTDAETVAVKGATITLYSGATAQASLTGLRVLWWDASAPDGTAPDYYSATESTDVAGMLSIDLDAVTTLAIGDYGYLHVHKAGTLGNAYQDALVFAGAVQVQDIA